MRGKVTALDRKDRVFRITPAYAGKSGTADPGEVRERDHPRLCGEKLSRSYSRRCVPGSPPPMRGKVSASGDVTGVKRITPAYAGKSPQQEDTRKNQRGSPPPMRGKVPNALNGALDVRITPAYAGKRVSSTGTPFIM